MMSCRPPGPGGLRLNRARAWAAACLLLLGLVALGGPALAQVAAAAGPAVPLAADVAAGARGDAAVVDLSGGLWRRDAASGAWAQAARGMTRVAIDGEGGLWALDAQGRVQRFEAGQWRTEAITGVDLAPTPEGGVIVATLGGQLARYDKARGGWSSTPGAAARVAVDAKGVIWIVGAQGAVMRSLGGAEPAWVSVTAQAADIAADGSGRVVIAGLDNRAYEWREATARWEPLALASSTVAVALGAGRLWSVEPGGQLTGEGPQAAGNPPPPAEPPRPAVPTRWVKLDAPAVQVAVASNADVFALDAAGSVWRLSAADVRAERFGNWARQPGSFARLRATQDGRLWAIDRAGGLWLLDGSVWRPAAAAVRDVAATPDGTAWLLRPNGQVQALADGAALEPGPPAAAGPVQTLQSDEHGLLWTTHAGGRVERFDGTRWQTAAEPPQALSGLALGAQGTVFAVSAQGTLLRRDARSGAWQVYGTPASAPIVTAAVGPDGLPWVIGSRGEFWAERPQGRPAEEPPLPSIFTRLLTWRPVGGGPVARVSVADDGGVLALGLDGAVWRWQGGTNWATVSGRLAAMAAAPNGRAWGLDGNGRVLQLQGGFWNELPGTARLIAAGPQGSLWALQGDDQIVRWDEPARRWVLVARALPRATALAVGPEAETWLIDEAGGVQLLRGSQWLAVPGVVARSIDIGPDGTVYASTAEEALVWLDRAALAWKPATGRVLQVAVGPGGAPWAVFAGNRLMASSRFLDEQQARDNASRQPPPPPPGSRPPVVVTPVVPPSLNVPLNYQQLASDMRVQDIGVGAEGSVFAVGGDGSLQCFNNPDQRFVTISPGQNQRVAVAADGGPWVQTANGAVSRFDKGQWRTVPEFSGRDLAVAPDGSVWAVGHDGASYRYAPAADRFERQPLARSDAPVKGRRIAGANRGVHWVASETNTLFQCQNGDCQTRLIGVADVAVAPDNTVFALDLLGNLQRYNETRRQFERVNGRGVALAVGPQGLPWLVAADGRVSTAGLQVGGGRGVRSASCAARFVGAPAPQPPTVGASLTAADDALVLPAGLAASVALLLDNDRLGGGRPALRDISVSLESVDGLLRVEGDVLQVAPSAGAGSVLAGTYRICSRAVAGQCASAQVRVTVAAVPGPPLAVTATAGSGQASVTFAPPATSGGSAITRYTVVSQPDGLSASGVASPVVVGGLRSGVSYTFTVTATNAVGTGPGSAPSNTVVPLAAPTVPGAPTAVVALAGNGQAAVSFAAPAADGGRPITGYTVTASPGGLTAAGLASPIVISGLSNGTAYSFTVAARNAVGSGAPSAPSSAVTPASVPGAPTAVVAVGGNAQLSVGFVAPVDAGGAPITAYTVTASPGGATASGAAAPIVLGGLSNGVPYTVTVTASNAVGAGLPSAPSAAVTPSTTPGAPTAVLAVAANASASVAFSVPASDGGAPITGYTVTASPGGASASGTASPIVVAGLSNGTTYSFTVQARNANGAGPASVASAGVTPAGLPGAPTAVVATAGPGLASVAFTAPASSSGAVITGYTVTASPGGASASGTASPIVVSGLSNGTAYTFTVRANSSAGSGPASTPSSPVVPATVPAAPSGVSDELQTTSEVMIDFVPPADAGGAPITGYRLVASPADPGLAVSLISPTRFRVQGLRFTTPYTFAVVASNRVGDSSPSAPSGVVNPSTRPSPPPAVSATPGNGSIAVTLAKPASDGGSPITGYSVLVFPLAPNGEPDRLVSGSGRTIVVGGLSNGVAYCYHGWARNANGRGATSPACPAGGTTPAQLPGAPTAVSALAGDAQASVSFVAPSSNGGSAITGYTVTASPGGASAGGAASPVVVTGLSNGTAYTFTVVAQNAVGAGPASVASNTVTPQPAIVPPGAPAAVSALSGSTIAQVSFVPPAFNGGSPITGYTVTASPGGASAAGAASPIALSGLVNGTAYTFTVRATNAAGPGAASLPSNAVTPAAAPGGVTVRNWGIFDRTNRLIHVFFNDADPGPPRPPANSLGLIDYTATAYDAATDPVGSAVSANPGVTSITATAQANFIQLVLPFDPCQVHKGSQAMRLTVVARSATGIGPLLYFNAGPALFGGGVCP